MTKDEKKILKAMMTIIESEIKRNKECLQESMKKGNKEDIEMFTSWWTAQLVIYEILEKYTLKLYLTEKSKIKNYGIHVKHQIKNKQQKHNKKLQMRNPRGRKRTSYKIIKKTEEMDWN